MLLPSDRSAEWHRQQARRPMVATYTDQILNPFRRVIRGQYSTGGDTR